MTDAGSGEQSNNELSSSGAADDAAPDALVGGILGRVCLIGFFFCILVIGAWVAGAGFHDPDTCWLVALGRVIFEQRGLPTTDPFSYTFAMAPAKSFVMYQWLTELILFCAFKCAGLIGILCVVALAVHTGFVVAPLFVFDRLNLSRLRSFCLIALAFAAASFHLLVRPEIFSYAALSLWLALMTWMRSDGGNGRRVNWKYVLLFALLMMVWANLHTGFTSGLIVLFVYVLFCSVQWIVSPAKGDSTVSSQSSFSADSSGPGSKIYPYWTAVVALVASVVATLVNPKGIGLWMYIPHLYFGHFNRTIVELQPLGLKELSDPAFYPFFLLTALAVTQLIRAWRGTIRDGSELLFSFALLVVLIYLGVTCRRLISFNSLIMIYECAWLRSLLPPRNDGVLTSASKKLKQLFKVDLGWGLLSSIVALSGVLLIATGPVKPRLPQPSSAFVYPEEVIQYMREHPPRGRGFNAPQFGDVMIWNLSTCPQIFIDTRFDMYGAQLVDRYMSIGGCIPGWQELFESYNCDWVFLLKNNPLALRLQTDPSWKTVASGANSIYMVRIR